MSRYFRAEITENFSLNSKNNLLAMRPLGPVINPEPGQFYMLEIGDSHDPLLKRPFSYFRRTGESIQFVYTVKGRGTSLMKDFRPGRTINVIGPLGSAYPRPENGYTPLLIGGGIGMASLFPLAEALARKAYMIYGARTKDELVALEELERSGAKIVTCTDDCSFGKEGLVTDILKDFLVSHSSLAPFIIYACGPRPMLTSVSKMAADERIKGYVSLEENMACGFGACLGCAVKTARGYKRVCKEGPVFPIEEIVWT